MNLAHGRNANDCQNGAVDDILPPMRFARVWMLLPLCLLFIGCPPKPGPGRSGKNGEAVWPFWPTRMRVHPSTRLVHEEWGGGGAGGGQHFIDARIEFFDHIGATSKACGQLTLQLLKGEPGGGDLETWNQDLRDLELNARQFDEITLTYLFRLQLGSKQVAEHAELRAYFLGADGQELQATMKIRN